MSEMRAKMKAISASLQKLEKDSVEKAKTSKTFDDNFEMSYFSGLLNGFNFAFFVMNGATEDEVDALYKRISHQETKN